MDAQMAPRLMGAGTGSGSVRWGYRAARYL